MSTEVDVRKLIHSPQKLNTNLVKFIDQRKLDPGITWGVDAIDDQVVPLHKGEIAAICGRPGMGKTTLMAHMCRIEAQRIAARNAEREIAVYVSWEQSVEELEAFFTADEHVTVSEMAWATADTKYLAGPKARERRKLPVWAIGLSIEDGSAMDVIMSLDIVLEALKTLKRDGYDVKLACLDYIQIIPSVKRLSGDGRRTAEVHEAAVSTKQLARAAGIPIYIGAQARQEVDDYKVPLPTQRDAQWASSIFQTVDKFFAVWRPHISWRDDPNKTHIKLNGREYDVNENLLVVKMWKQRMERPIGLWPLFFDPAFMKLGPMNPSIFQDEDTSHSNRV